MIMEYMTLKPREYDHGAQAGPYKHSLGKLNESVNSMIQKISRSTTAARYSCNFCLHCRGFPVWDSHQFETRFWGWLFQKVCAGFTCMASYLFKAWFHNLARIWAYLTTYLWYTGIVTTNRSLYRMLYEKAARGSKFGVAQNLMKINAYITGGICSYLYDELRI